MELDHRVRVRIAELQSEVTENRKIQKQLLRTQKPDAVGTMAPGNAHDVNNSWATITGFAEVTRLAPSDSDELIEYILTASRQAADSARGLLTFSQDTAGEKVPQNISQIMQENSAFLQKMLPKSIRLNREFEEDVSMWCSTDIGQIQQVILNITMNARNALPDGGEISLSANEHPTQQEFVQLTIADNGSGMSDDVMQKGFDSFFTTKKRGRGTGLGMAVVHGIIKEHGGTIRI